MAQRAKIGINGDPLGFDELLDRIQTSGIGGGSMTWVPEADTRCETLNVTANGTYSAAQAGKYGYDYVTVSVPGSSVTGRDPDTGEAVEVHKDPETGEIVETVIPVEIRVTTPPTKTVYTHGETIDYSGIVVHAYSATGQDMGEVPFSELVFPETTADAQKTDEWTDGQGLNATMLYYTPHYTYLYNSRGEITNTYIYYVSGQVLGTFNGRQATYGSQESPATILATRYEGENYLVSLTGQTYGNLFDRHTHSDTDNWDGWVFSGSGGGVQTGVFKRHGFGEYLTDLPISTVDPTTVDPANLHATQSLPVQWPCTGDGAVLETSFNIQVNSAA